MDKPISFKRIARVEGELCQHCTYILIPVPYEENSKGYICPCNGTSCNEAYKNYLKNFKKEIQL